MWSFGWNDAALYAISIIGIIAILILRRKQFKYKQTILYIIFISIAILAALAGTAITHDSIGALITRAIVFEGVSIYFLATFR